MLQRGVCVVMVCVRLVWGKVLLLGLVFLVQARTSSPNPEITPSRLAGPASVLQQYRD